MAEESLKLPDKERFDIPNAVIAGLVFVITFFIYNMTKAPTFSFWDCGEFVASSYILGIPHPPGSPLYILLGRVFSVLPIASDIGVRINYLSVFPSAVAATFGYLIVVRVLRFWYKESTHLKNRIVIYIGGFTGALFMAFGTTNWTNAVEAEVYAATIMFMVVIYWLALKYFSDQERPGSARYMLLAVYLSILGVGIHLTLFMVLPIAALYFILKREATIRDWAILALFFILEFYLIFQFSSNPLEVPFYLPSLIALVIFLFITYMESYKGREIWITSGLFLIALYPFYFVIVESISRKLFGVGLSGGLTTAGDIPLGWIGVFGLVIWGIFNIVQLDLSGKSRTLSSKRIIIGLISLVPGLLIGMNSIDALHGYQPFIVITFLILIGVVYFLRHSINWLILIGMVAVALIVLGFWNFVYGLLGGAVLICILGYAYKNKSWKVAVAIILMAVMGFSVHLFIPIRSAHDPVIDENNPETFIAFKNYLERKQYGNVSMTQRMFDRRAEWSNQFGDHRRMGFWRFFKDQYGFGGARFVIILLLGFYGLWETIRRRPKIGLPLFLLIIFCTIGLVFYMNFADGTRMSQVKMYDYLEVRDRDYFFTPAFVFFGLAIGLGIAAFMELIRESVSEMSQVVRKTAFGMSTLLVLLPLFPITQNYNKNDRTGNYMPYDYAYNELMSCREGAVLITNADNDTFPAWCIQEVYGVRKDVRVVNLSLANTHWYIKQLRDVYKLPLKWSDEQIDALLPYRDQQGNVFRIQDRVVEQLLTNNNGSYPVNVSVTVQPGKLNYKGQSLSDKLVLEGMVYRLDMDRDITASAVNYHLTDSLYNSVFQFRGVADSNVFKDEATRRLTNNYAQGFLYLADSLRKIKDYEGALVHIRQGLEVLPRSYDIYAYAAQMLGEMNRYDTLEVFIQNAPIEEKHRLYFNWGMAVKYNGDLDGALKILEKTYLSYPDYVDVYRGLVRIYYENKYYSKLRAHVEEWVVRHPDDFESKELLNQIRQVNAGRDSAEGK